MLYLVNADVVEKLGDLTKYSPQMNVFSSELPFVYPYDRW